MKASFPSASDLRFGAGIGGRFYTNFGPLRVDVATPLNQREGDGRGRALHLDRAGVLMADGTTDDTAPAEVVSVRRPLWLRILKWIGIALLGAGRCCVLIVLFGINTDPGRRFVADQIGELSRPRPGSTSGSGGSTDRSTARWCCATCACRDPKGVFLTSPRLDVDWRPFAYPQQPCRRALARRRRW